MFPTRQAERVEGENLIDSSLMIFVDVLHMSRNKYRIGRPAKYGPEQTNYVYCTVIMFNFGNLP